MAAEEKERMIENLLQALEKAEMKIRQKDSDLAWCACCKAATSEGVALDTYTKFFVTLDAPSFPLIASA